VPCTGDQATKIQIVNFLLGVGLHVFVNGVDVTAQLDVAADLTIAPGTYDVEVRDGQGTVLFANEAFTVAPCTQAEPTPTPTPTVVAATPTPKVTPPPTDTAGPASGSTGSGSGLVLLLLGGLSLGTALLTPATRRVRR
jgi:hypothetical protein